jgi:hypothetical protein
LASRAAWRACSRVVAMTAKSGWPWMQDVARREDRLVVLVRRGDVVLAGHVGGGEDGTTPGAARRPTRSSEISLPCAIVERPRQA